MPGLRVFIHVYRFDHLPLNLKTKTKLTTHTLSLGFLYPYKCTSITACSKFKNQTQTNYSRYRLTLPVSIRTA